jgi:phenylalanyl-tRNA synthetase alpha chain
MTFSDPDLQRIADRFEQAVAAVTTLPQLVAVRNQFLSRAEGEASAAVKLIATRPPEARRTFGAEANALKREIDARLAALEAALRASGPVEGAFDVTLPGLVPHAGRRHLLTEVRARVEEIFLAMGYEVIEGPELEDDWHNFEALNMPPDHPARDMQDTLYLAAPVPAAGGGRPATLLRTHTSGMQIRHMEAHPPPARLIAIGRVYRRDDVDATHSPMFTQVEGLVVDEGISLADLKGTLHTFADRFFSAGVRTRFRPSFFPYTEPSAELDVECQNCRGSGCGLCKHTGWIEVLGCGMVHPSVFEAVGYDPERLTGFAFGIGIERLALRLYGLDDIRLFFENDLRLLGQVAP